MLHWFCSIFFNIEKFDISQTGNVVEGFCPKLVHAGACRFLKARRRKIKTGKILLFIVVQQGYYSSNR